MIPDFFVEVIKIRIKTYITNPLGKGAIFPNREAIVSDLEKRYIQLKTERHFTLDMYVRRRHLFFFHVKVPSENLDNFYYDVIVKFKPNKTSGGISILDMDIEVFSNSPAFVYTYAYVFNKVGMFTPEFKSKLPRETFKEKPEVKNPFRMINFEKSIYFACRYILDYNMVKLTGIRREAKTFNQITLSKKIRDFDTLMKKHKIQERKERRERDKEKKERKKIERSMTKKPIKRETDELKKSVISYTKRVKRTKSSKKVSKKRSTKRIK